MIFSIHVCFALVEQQPLQRPVLLHLRAVLSTPTPEEHKSPTCIGEVPSLHVPGWPHRALAHFSPADAMYKAGVWTALVEEAFGTDLEHYSHEQKECNWSMSDGCQTMEKRAADIPIRMM